MKKTLLMLSLLACLCYTAQAAPCLAGTLATYTASGFSCSFADGLTFSEFTYTASATGAFAPDAMGVAVNPEIVGGEVGFIFSAGWVAGQNQVEDALITFTATCAGCLIEDLKLVMGGGAIGSGAASVSETSLAPVVSLITGGLQLQDSTTFATPVGSISVSKDIVVSGGSALGGLGHISRVDNLFSTNSNVPEPSLGLLCLGVLTFIPIARRKLGRS